MITSFANKGTEDIFNGSATKDARALLPAELWARAAKLLDRVNTSLQPGDLRLPPSNNLEKLAGDRKGQWSVRINSKYRICFKLQGGHASDVEVVDYH